MSSENDKILYQLETDIKYLSKFIDEYKDSSANFSKSLELLNNNLNVLKLKTQGQLSDVTNDVETIQTRVAVIEKSLVSIDSTISSNFFNDIDFKKGLFILAVLLSLVGSPTLLDEYLGKDTGDSVDRLIELLQKNETPTP